MLTFDPCPLHLPPLSVLTFDPCPLQPRPLSPHLTLDDGALIPTCLTLSCSPAVSRQEVPPTAPWAELELLVADPGCFLFVFFFSCRNDFTTTQQAVEVDSIVLTCPEVPGSNLHKHLSSFFFLHLPPALRHSVWLFFSLRHRPEEETLNVKRWVQQKRRPLEDGRSFPLQDRAAEVHPKKNTQNRSLY